MRSITTVVACFWAISAGLGDTASAFQSVQLRNGPFLRSNAGPSRPTRVFMGDSSSSSTTTERSTTASSVVVQASAAPLGEAQKLLERAAQLRAEIAKAEGKTLEEVEEEAKAKREGERLRQEQVMDEAAAGARAGAGARRPEGSDHGGGMRVQLPETVEDMVRQAARASERAFRDGITRQTIRFNLVREGQRVARDENEWPGGTRQMYREAGRPLTEAFLREIRAPTKDVDDGAALEQRRLAPVLKQQDIWDFDGSALHAAEAREGPSADVQALVFPNTDVKYLEDISKISHSMGSRLFVLINPFWRNVDSWGFNLLAPGAKRKAQDVIFEQGFDVTYSMMVFSVRGESCATVKAYPHDWQLFAFREDDYYPTEEFAIRLGSCKEEPTSALITDLLNARPEFRDTRTLRQMKKNIQG
jgi:Domain of unknown function (DUF1995)